ncbi:MAG TPA: hypothetical protein VK708_22915, partial [Bryobacteraceae bacterium]|nr:hypothetical protein [Bryobacteraceae bacterium]
MENRGEVWFLAAEIFLKTEFVRSVSPGGGAGFNIRLGPHWRFLLLLIFFLLLTYDSYVCNCDAKGTMT